MMKLPDAATLLVRHGRTFQRLVDEVKGDPGGVVVIAGEGPTVRQLRAELTGKNGSGTVRAAAGPSVGPADLQDALVLVYAIRGELSGADEAALRHADRARVPVVCLYIDAPASRSRSGIPYVLASDVVHAADGQPFPIDPLVARLAARVGPRGFALAADVAAMRGPVCDAIVAHYSRLNGAVGAAVFVPGVDLPVLTLNQLRMVARIAAAHGVDLDSRRLADLALVVSAGLGFRSAARYLMSLVPVAGWAVKGGVAFGGTQAIGRAAVARFDGAGLALGRRTGEGDPAA